MSAPATSAAPADITASRLQLFAPQCDYMALAPHLDGAAKAHGIATPRQLRHWLAQIHVESLGLVRLEENLHYSANALLKTWPAHFTPATATKCTGNPKAIACAAYGGRDGNVQPLDGWTYRGRGFVQLTGRANYADAGRRLGRPYEAQPDLVAQPEGAALTAADFWSSRDLGQVLADHTDEGAAATAIRRKINGGSNGLQDALRQLQRAAQIWRA